MTKNNLVGQRVKSFIDDVKKTRGQAPKALVKDADNGVDLFIYDAIDEYWGISANSVAEALSGIDAPRINVRINSPGGVVTDGIAIMTLLANHDAEIHTYNDGLAASIASIIMMAGETRTMSAGAWNMIHEPWAVAVGNANDMRETAGLLDQFSGQLVDVYAKGTGQDKDFIKGAMADETWYTADESKELGFIDSINEIVPVNAKFTANITNLFDNTPNNIDAKIKQSQERTRMTRRDVEGALRDAGASRTDAKLMAKGAVSELMSREDSDEQQILAVLNKATNTIKGK